MAWTRCMLCALMLLCFEQTHGYGWWVHQPYDETSEYDERAPYLANITLACGAPGGNRFEYWIMPDMTVAEEGYERTKITLDGPAGWHVMLGGDMEIRNVQEFHFGFYTCRTEDGSGSKHAVKRSLNVKGAYFPDLWEKYRMPTIIGLSAGAGFLVVATTLCLVYNHKVYGPAQRKEDAQAAGTSNVDAVNGTAGGGGGAAAENKAFDDKELNEVATAL